MFGAAKGGTVNSIDRKWGRDAMNHEVLMQFQNLLYARLEEILPGLRGSVFCFESSGGNPDPMDEADLACARNDRELSLRIHQRNRQLVQEIFNALSRIRSGEFGICEECGYEIEVNRMKVQPTATVCVACKKSLEAAKRLKAA